MNLAKSDQTDPPLIAYLDQKKQQLLDIATKIKDLLPDDAAKNTMQLPSQSSAKRVDMFNKIFSQVNLTGNSKVSDLQATAAPSISQNQVENQEQSEDEIKFNRGNNLRYYKCNKPLSKTCNYR